MAGGGGREVLVTKCLQVIRWFVIVVMWETLECWHPWPPPSDSIAVWSLPSLPPSLPPPVTQSAVPTLTFLSLACLSLPHQAQHKLSSHYNSYITARTQDTGHLTSTVSSRYTSNTYLDIYVNNLPWRCLYMFWRIFFWEIINIFFVWVKTEAGERSQETQR